MGIASDEGRHQPSAAPGWAEVFELEYWSGHGELGGFARIEIRPDLGACWFWTALVGRERRLVTVLEFGADLPRWPGLEIRGPSLWAEMVVETPWDHVSLGLEAFAVELADPGDVFDGCRGDLVPLGYDLEWETVDRAPSLPGAAPDLERPPYPVESVVHGEILLGSEVIDFEGPGRRHHWLGATSALGAGEPEAQTRVVGLPEAPVELPDGSRRKWVLDPAGPYWAAVSR